MAIVQPIRNLVNGTRINGVEHFYQTTKPTVRGDNSALVVGDRWWKSNTGEEWFWNGTYWLSETLYFTVSTTEHGGAVISTIVPAPFIKQTTVYIESFTVNGALANTPQDANNYWLFYFNLYYGSTSQFLATSTISTNSFNFTSANFSYTLPLNVVRQDALFADGSFQKIGSPGGLRRTNLVLNYRLVN